MQALEVLSGKESILKIMANSLNNNCEGFQINFRPAKLHKLIHIYILTTFKKTFYTFSAFAEQLFSQYLQTYKNTY